MPARTAHPVPSCRPGRAGVSTLLVTMAAATLAALTQTVWLDLEDAMPIAGLVLLPVRPAGTPASGASQAPSVSQAPRLSQATVTGILPMRACHSLGPVLCTLVPDESTATVTGMSLTSNS